VRGGEAVEEDRGGRKLLRIKITADVGRVEGEHIVDPVVREYTITFGRYGADNAALGFATARVDAPGGREADAERLAAAIEALTGVKPRIRRMKNGQIMIVCGREHLEGFSATPNLQTPLRGGWRRRGGEPMTGNRKEASSPYST